ncbi:MAG: hypothetical protein WBX00_37135 [Isosphaeraceae bacterium]|jgi:hypothetical protein
MPPVLSEKNFEATIEQGLTQALPAPGPATARQKKGLSLAARAVFLRVAHVLAWAGSTIPQAPKERQFIAWGVSPRTQERRQKMPFPAPSGRHARAVAEPSCRPDWGSEQGTGRLGTSWGLRLQATNCRRYAARENPVICNP